MYISARFVSCFTIQISFKYLFLLCIDFHAVMHVRRSCPSCLTLRGTASSKPQFLKFMVIRYKLTLAGIFHNLCSRIIHDLTHCSFPLWSHLFTCFALPTFLRFSISVMFLLLARSGEDRFATGYIHVSLPPDLFLNLLKANSFKIIPGVALSIQWYILLLKR